MLVAEEKSYGNIDVGSITSKLMSKGIGLNVNLSLGGSSSTSTSGGSFSVNPAQFAKNYYQKWGGLLFQKPQTFGVSLFGNNVSSWLNNIHLISPDTISKQLGIGNTINVTTLAGKTPKPSLGAVAQQNNGSFLSSLWGGVKDIFGGVFQGIKQSLPNLLQTYIGLKLSKPIIKEKMKLQMMASGGYNAQSGGYNTQGGAGGAGGGETLPPEYIEYLRNQNKKDDTGKYLLIGGAALAGIVLLTLLMHRD